MQCVAVDANGFLVTDPAPVDSCTGYVVVTPAELQGLQSVWQPLALSDGVAIGSAMLLALATAWVWRALRSFAWGWSEQGD